MQTLGFRLDDVSRESEALKHDAADLRVAFGLDLVAREIGRCFDDPLRDLHAAPEPVARAAWPGDGGTGGAVEAALDDLHRRRWAGDDFTICDPEEPES